MLWPEIHASIPVSEKVIHCFVYSGRPGPQNMIFSLTPKRIALMLDLSM